MPKDDTNTQGSDRLRQARLKRGFKSARAAARYFGFNQNTYSLHENGERGLGRAYERYAEAYKVPPSWLLRGEGSPGWDKDPSSGEPRAETPLSLDPDFLREALTFVLQGMTDSERHARELARIAVDCLSEPPIEEVDLDPLRSFRVRFRLGSQKFGDPTTR